MPFADKHELYDVLVDHVRDFAIILLDPEGRVASWNVGAQRILGYQEDEILGRRFNVFFTAEDNGAGRPENELAQARTSGSVDDDNWMVRKDGSRFYASGITSRLAGEPLRGYAKIFRDLTDRRRLEEEAQKRVEQLAAADRYKDEFLAMLSHELRAPLAPITNALELLRFDLPAGTTAHQAHAILERQVRHMTRLVDDLLDVARISSGKIALRKERVDLGTILQQAVEATRPFIDTRQHTLSVDLPAEPVQVLADPARIQQAVSNLLTNAAKYTLPGGRIWLTAERKDAEVAIAVRDNGIGIAASLLPNVFDLFVQGERTADRAQGGLGIGLTLVRNIAEMHDGAVHAASAGLGQGSEFTLVLPLASADPLSVPESLERLPVTRILVVDDSLDTADSLAMLLTLGGYDVRTANDGIAAVAVAREFHPDVMLLDIGLPGADGYKVAERVRDDAALGDAVTLIAMSGYGRHNDRERSRAAGFRAHLVKPIDLGALHALLPPSRTPANATAGGNRLEQP